MLNVRPRPRRRRISGSRRRRRQGGAGRPVTDTGRVIMVVRRKWRREVINGGAYSRWQRSPWGEREIIEALDRREWEVDDY